MQVPERGDLVYLNLSPQSGHEPSGNRPGIVLSPELFNQGKFLAICPIMSEIMDYPFEVRLPEDAAIKGAILTDQVRTVDWRSRDLNIKGHAPDEITTTCLKRIYTFL
ncbi:type II toxin-antitoxin system PemK/MazF family toxin [Salibacterium lacus]|uniref:Type II toxin-antitoxin system PemK/MazF family toxin n=1 Tax=Salibacterium lacus TaxID=1898109 RepID=A0ABW5T4P7_9BACI